MRSKNLSRFMAWVLPLCAVGVASPSWAQSDYDSRFISYPTYGGNDLEMTVDKEGTHFRLWSPKAEEVVVNLYDNGHTGSPFSTL
ncbi:MAG: hypothetical protein K2M45_00355, partial [Muribaculaceae bacterium]|nr:hypothetical protein [Muribaculaceae bacterium]